MRRLLITGGSGFVGANLAAMASGAWEVFVTRHRTVFDEADGIATVPLDITDAAAVQNCMETVRPNAVIHTAATTSLNACFDEPQLARTINVEATGNIASAAKAVGTRMVYTSTDLVYAGNGSFYAETDEARPTCLYGQTKLAGENVIRDSGAAYSIARVAMVYGWNRGDKQNFTESLIDSLAAGKPNTLFSTEYRCPVYVDDLCEILLEMADRPQLTGVFNVGGSQRASRYEFGQILADIFDLPGHLLTPGEVRPEHCRDHRPEDCSMNIDKLTAAIGRDMPDIAGGLAAMRQVYPR